MNRGSDERVPALTDSGFLASMRPRFMNRGSAPAVTEVVNDLDSLQ